MLTLPLTVKDIMSVFRTLPIVTRCTQYLSSVPMEPFSIKIILHVNGGSMLTAASPPPCTARMRDCLLTQEDHQVVVEVPALLSLLSLHPHVLAQYLPAGHQDNLMVTALTLDYAALMAAATLVEKQRPRLNLYLK